MSMINYLLWQMYTKSFLLEDNYRYGHNKVVTALHSFINDYLKTSLVQHRY